MEKTLKAKWLKALRSGRYKQAQGCLKDNDKFCCLGVLADVQGCAWKKDDYGRSMPIIDGKGANTNGCGFLEPRFAGGIRRATQEKLADMNDCNNSFEAIADYIEKRL